MNAQLPSIEDQIRNRIEKMLANNWDQLSLCGLGLTALPDEVLTIPGLKKLDLSNNALKDLPEGWHQLKQLVELDLSQNCFEHVPPALRASKSLQVLRLANNLLKSLDLESDLPTRIKELNVSHNSISRIVGLGRPATLRDLVAEGNEVEDLALAAEVKGSRLDWVHLDHNRLKSLPDDIGMLQNISAFYLNHNRIQHISSALSQLPRLSDLRMDDNELASCNWTKDELPRALTYLSVRDNHFQALPDCLEELTRLETLRADRNPLEALPRLPASLQTLSARGCKLTTLPNLQFNTRLVELDLAVNAISGAGVLTLSAQMRRLYLSDNQLTSLHIVIPKGAALEKFWMSGNQIGQLTAEGMLGNLRVMELSSNRLLAVPDFFSQSRYLSRVYLADNLLEEIPQALASIPAIKTLALSKNRIKAVPDWLTKMSWPSCLWLDHNPLEHLAPGLLKRSWLAFILHKTPFAELAQPIKLRSWLLGESPWLQVPVGSPPDGNWQDRLWVETKPNAYEPYQWTLSFRSASQVHHLNVAYLEDLKVGRNGIYVLSFKLDKIVYMPIGPLSEVEQADLLAFLQAYYQSSQLAQYMDLQDMDEGPSGMGELEYVEIQTSEEFLYATAVSQYSN